MRALNTATLNGAAKDYAGQFLLPSQYSKTSASVATGGREWVLQSLYNLHFKDEFEHVLAGMKDHLGKAAVEELNEEAGKRFTPRHDDVFEQLLAEKLAIRPNGDRIKGAVGTVVVGEKIVGHRPKLVQLRNGREVTLLKPIKERVFAGQQDSIVGATVMNISAEIAILGLDAALDGLDEGTGAAVIQGRTGAQPADPDAATTGTNLFTLVMSDPAFAGASDQADGTVQAAASSITDDASAAATGTLGYCRVSATNDGATPIDDHIDGEAGTSGADFNFNTLSIVSGATVSMSSYTVTWSQGSTAS